MDSKQMENDMAPVVDGHEIERAKRDITFAIEEAFYDASDDGYYVGWHDTLGFESAYLDATEEVFDSLVDAGSYDAALAAGIEALRCVERLEVDDSFGFLDSAITSTVELFRRLARVKNDAFTGRLVDALATFLETPPERDSARETFELQETDVAEFLFGRFGRRRAHARRLEALCRGRVEEARGSRDCHAEELVRVEAELEELGRGRQTQKAEKQRSSLEAQRRSLRSRIASAEYDLETWMPRLLCARRLEGATLEELLDEAAGDVALDPVALYFAELAVKRHDTKRAIAHLEAARDYHGARGHHRRDVHHRLAELYGTDDIDAMRGELMWLIADARGKHADEAPELWLRLRDSYGEEWEQVRDRLLTSLETDTMLACIRAEDRWDDLMDAVERLDEVPHRYERELQQRYPERVLRHALLHPRNALDLEGKVRTLWDKTRSSVTEDEWAKVWPGLVEAMGRAEMRMAYLAREGAWEALMDEAEKAGVRSLDLYRDQLLEHCPDRLVAAYAADLRERAKLKRSSRQLYRDFVDRARMVRDLPGGQEVVEPLVLGMRERYQSRPALLEELDRL